MLDLSRMQAATAAMVPATRAAGPGRLLVVALIAFLTVVDLFATQALLPLLTRAYGVTPAAMGLAVNAGTLGMAIAGLLVARFGGRLDRRRGIAASLALLAAPTAGLAFAPDLASFAALRILQGLCMATGFSLTLAHLAERLRPAEAAAASAAYITGNVASNFIGRLVAASLADHLGLAPSFLVFALLNLAGAVLVLLALGAAPPPPPVAGRSALAAMRAHLAVPDLKRSFAIGFLILFAFIGTFTFVNFVLVAEPIAIGMMALGLVYVVFVPSIVTTPLAGRAARALGARTALMAGLALALLALPLLLLPSLAAVMAGLVLVGVGTFAAQAVATGLVGRTATSDRAAASGLYLAAYFTGGLVGTAVLGGLFEGLGWAGCVAGIALALVLAILLATKLERRPA